MGKADFACAGEVNYEIRPFLYLNLFRMLGRANGKNCEFNMNKPKFEIENYWKRANYFWFFQVSVFAGYILVITKENAKIPYVAVLELGIICLIITVFFKQNKGV